MTQSTRKHPQALVILDGFGHRTEPQYNPIQSAHMAHYTSLFSTYPHALLAASGTSVGLLEGMIGNSQVGHLTIGAGRIIDQPITVTLDAIAAQQFPVNKEIIPYLRALTESGKALHIIGLASDAGVHCHTAILRACIDLAHEQGIRKIIVHPILDGRDVPPQSAQQYIKELEAYTKTHGATLGTLMGRFYAMDRNNNWERTAAAYTVLTHAEFILRARSVQKTIQEFYNQGITDEFIPPIHLDADSIIEPGDGIIMCNTRADRVRQLTQLLCKTHASFIATGIPYFSDDIHTEIPLIPLYEPPVLSDTLIDILAERGKTVFTCAESEKYAHITYFFKGGKEDALPNETRVIIPSHSPRTFVDHPEMCAPEITKAVIDSLRTSPCDFYLINYANPDMVGHSGNFDATVKAVQCIDTQLGILYTEIVEKLDGTLYITSDHGKAEILWDEALNQAYTAHTTNPVPFIMIRKDLAGKPNLTKMHTLADITPLILSTLK